MPFSPRMIPKGGPWSAIGNQASGAQNNRVYPTGAGSNPVDDYANGINLYTQFHAPDFAQVQGQVDSGRRQYGYSVAQNALNAQNAQSDYGYANQLLDQDYAQLGIDRADLRRQQGYYDDLYANDVARYGVNDAYQAGNQQFADMRQQLNDRSYAADGQIYDIAGQQYGLDGETYGIAGKRYGLAGERYGLQGQTHESVLAQIANQVQIARRGAYEGDRNAGSDASQAGAFTGVGHRMARDDIAAALGFKTADLAETKQQELINRQQQGVDYKEAGLVYDEAGIAYKHDGLQYQLAGVQYDKAGIAHDSNTVDYMQTTSDIANKRNNLNFDLQDAGLTHDEQVARLESRLQGLDVTAAKYGINRQQLISKLQQALSALHLDNQMSAGQLADLLNNAQSANSAIVMQILQQAGLG